MNPAVSAPVSRHLRVEMLVVLGLSFGKSAVYALLSLINKLTLPVALNQQTTRMNTSTTPDRPWLDLAYEIANLVLPLMPVVLVLYLLWTFHRPIDGAFGSMGFDLSHPVQDLMRGFAIFAGIGIAGLAFYFGARELGINTNVSPANLSAAWWTIPILLLKAAMNGILEEVVMIGYLFTRWRQSGGGVVAVLVGSALIRGGYHLYQGPGAFIANAIMGVLFGMIYLRTKRVMPLVVCHTLLDIFAFVGYALLKPYIAWL